MIMKRRIQLIIAIAAIACAATSACAENWPLFKNNGLRNGTMSTEMASSVRFAGQREWTTQLWQNIASSPAVYKEKVYFGSNDGVVYALNLYTGEQLWKFSTDNWVTSSPAVVNGRLYVGSFDSRLYCLNADTGEMIWKFTTSNSIQTSPAVADDAVYFGSNDGNVYAVSIKKWANPINFMRKNVFLCGTPHLRSN